MSWDHVMDVTSRARFMQVCKSEDKTSEVAIFEQLGVNSFPLGVNLVHFAEKVGLL